MDLNKPQEPTGNEGHKPKPKHLKPSVKALGGVDRRTDGYRRYATLFKALEAYSPLKPGPGKEALVAQGASLSLAYEALTAELLNGKPKTDALVRVSNSLNRVLATLGIVSWVEGSPDEKKPDLKKLRDPNTWKKE